MNVTQSYVLKANSGEFSETFTLDIKDVSGEAADANLVLKGTCGGTCVAAVRVPAVAGAKGRRMSGSVTHKGQDDRANTTTAPGRPGLTATRRAGAPPCRAARLRAVASGVGRWRCQCRAG